MSRGDGLEPWDGFWRLPDESELRDGFYSITQFTAKQLLQAQAPRCQWEGDFLQCVLLDTGKLSPLRSYWLDRLSREFSGERRAA